jgi:hypothetical protein
MLGLHNNESGDSDIQQRFVICSINWMRMTLVTDWIMMQYIVWRTSEKVERMVYQVIEQRKALQIRFPRSMLGWCYYRLTSQMIQVERCYESTPESLRRDKPADYGVLPSSGCL